MPDISLLQKRYGEEEGVKWQKALLIFSVALIIFLAASYIFLNYRKNVLIKKIESFKNSISEVFGQEGANKLNNLQTFNNSLKMGRTAKENHIYSSSIFYFLESVTLPQVSFSSLSFNADNLTLNLQAQSISYTMLAKQLDILEKNPKIKSVEAGSIGLDSLSGTVNFSLKIELNQIILRK